MTEYAKREDVIEALMCYFIPPIYTGEQVDQAKNLAESIMNGVPTIDIVRCKDCKYSRVYALDSNEKPRRWCVRGLVKAVDDDDYCSCGE